MKGADLYGIRFGSLIVVDKQPRKAEDKVSSQGFAGVPKRLRDLMDASPVTTQPPEGDLKISDHVSFVPTNDDLAAMRASPTFTGRLTCQVRWAAKNQELMNYSGPCLEEFTLAYDGNVYSVIAKCPEATGRPYSFIMGREGRRILASIFGASIGEAGDVLPVSGENWDLTTIGPCPMYLMLWVAFADEPETFALGRDLIHRGDTCESLVVLPRKGDQDRIVADIVDRLWFPVEFHYDILALRLSALDHEFGLYNHFESASRTYQQTLVPLSLDPRTWRTRWSVIPKLRSDVAKAYEDYAEFEECRAQISAQERRVSELFAFDELLEPHRNYVRDIVDDVTAWNGDHLLRGVGFFAEESRSRSLEWVTLAGPVLGAGIALGATALTLALS